MKIAILAGEASGDLIGASLIKSLRERCPDAQFEGIGGPAMIGAGFKSLFDIERLSVMGIIEPLKRLPDLLRLRKDVCEHFLKNPPDVFIGIDAPDFNLGIERKLREAGIPTVHYVSPSVWAWRQGRIHKIKKSVDLMLTLFPFEKKFYDQHQVPATYVGHPLAQQIPLETNTAAAKKSLGLDEKAVYVALMPGSRKQEIKYMAEPYLLAAKQIMKAHPDIKFITSQINEKRYEEFYAAFKKYAPELPLSFFIKRASDVFAAADVVLVTSGTATLEAMLHKKPMIIAYKMSPIIYKMIRWMIKAPYAGLPNIIANELLVPELIQQEVTPGAIADLLLDYINHPEKRDALKTRFTALHQTLMPPSPLSAADAILKLLYTK